MSILLQETGGGGNANTVSTSRVTPIEDGNDGSTLAVDNGPATKDACTGDCHYGRSLKQYVELLIQKTVIDVDEYEKQQDETSPETDCVCKAQSDSSDCHNPEQAEQQKQLRHEEHSEHLFPLNCCCRMCIVSREVVMKLYAEDCQYNSLWDRLQLLMKQYYDLIPESEDNALYNQYMELMSKSSLKWLTDAHYPEQNIIQMSLASNLPLSNEMAFVMLTNVLSTRDPHQLFELLCFQLRSIVQVYCVGFEDLFTENTEDGSRQFNAPEVLNYIVNGYKKLRQSARTVAPLLNVLEQCHLGKFGLTWWLINQRIFQRYFYYEVQSILPECMLRLRGSLPEREYQELVGRFLKFDKEMTDISLSWADVWPLLYDYHRSQEDCERRCRISTVHTLLQAIRGSRYTPKSPELFEKPERPISEWLAMENRKLVWEYVVHCLKTKWIPGVSSRLSNVCDYVKCPGCDRPLNTHNIVCVCLTCIIGGGIFTFRPKKEINERYRMCTCANMVEMILESQGKKAPDNDEDDSTTKSHQLLSSLLLSSGETGMQNGSTDVFSQEHATLLENESKRDDKQTVQDSVACIPLVESLCEDEELYHISWAIFKHLPERVQYRWSTLEPSRFCSFQAAQCSSIACRVAVNLIAMNYPVHLSRLLIQTYKPVSEEPRRIMKGNWNTKARNSLRKFCDNVNKRWHEEINDQMHPLLFVDMFWSLQNSALNLPKTRASDLAEWFILDTQAPPRNIFYQYFTKFFLVKENDIAFDLECFERERERSVSPSRMRESLMKKLESNAALLAPCPTTLSSSVSSTSSSSSSSSCLSSSNSSSSSSCSLSTTSAASVAAAAAAAAAAASSFIEPMGDSCIVNGITDEGRGCTCTCNSCVTEFLSKSEMLSKQLDTSARDSWTQRTNMLEMELKALLKERNMLLEKGRGKRNPCKLLHCDDSCAAKSGTVESSKHDLKTESDGMKASAAKQEVQCTVPESTQNFDLNGQQEIETLKDENVISREKTINAMDVDLAAQTAQRLQTTTQSTPLSKASLNDNCANPSSTSSVSTQETNNTPRTTPATATIVSNEELLTPAKLSAFAKLAASKIPAPVGNTATKSPSKQASAACPNGPATKTKPSIQQQLGNGGRTAPNTGTLAVAPTQTHSSSKPCPCGLPSHAGGAKAGTVSKSKPTIGTAAQGSANGGATVHSKEEHKKSCHRGTAPTSASGGEKAEGSCVCYYCTLFGQSECNHNQRTNETREKLRKKLQKQQMMNDKMFNEERQKQQLQQKSTSTDGATVSKECKPVIAKTVVNNIPGAPSSALNKACPTFNTVNTSANGNGKAVSEKGSKKTAKSAAATTPSKDRFQSIDDLLRFIEGDDVSKGSEKSSGGASKLCSTHNTVPSASGNTKAATEKGNKKTVKTATSASTPSKDRFQSIDDLLRYIEGDDTAKAPNSISKSNGKANRIHSADKSIQKPLPATKPTATVTTAVGKDTEPMKKAKLNESLKMIAELEVLRQRFYDCQQQEQKTQQLLQDQTGLSKKERKELPIKIQTYRQQKNELHAAINVLVSSIRNEIPEYPFKLEAFATPTPCCPPAQHASQQTKSSQSFCIDNVQGQAGRRIAPGAMLPPPPSTLTAAAKTNSNVRSTTIAKLQETLSLFHQKRQHHPDEIHQQQDQMLHQHLQHLKQQQQGASTDPASRQMVTIKRTFLPHTEPQVTVTAKGDSPDQDQILYTFINGQIVPINDPVGESDGIHQYQKTRKLGPKMSDYTLPEMGTSDGIHQYEKTRKLGPKISDSTIPVMGASDGIHQYPKTRKLGPKISDSTLPVMGAMRTEKGIPGTMGGHNMQKPEDPFADFTPQEKRLVQEYVDQLYQQPLDTVQIEDSDQIKRSSRSKKRSGKLESQQQEQQQTISINDLIQERMLRQSVELMKKMKKDRKGNPEMLSLANKVKKDLLEMQKNPKPVTEIVNTVAGKNNANLPLNNHPTERESIAKQNPVGDDLKGGKGNAAAVATTAVDTGKGKIKKERKKDKLIEEIDEIVARLNLIDSDEEESKPSSKKKQKSSASSAKVLNRKQSKDSVVSSGSGSGSGMKQQTKSQSKQQPTQQQLASIGQEKYSNSEESQTKKRGTTVVTKKSTKDNSSANEKAPNKDTPKGQSQQTVPTVDTSSSLESSLKPVIRKKAPKTFIDPEFDNNAFRLLNMDDSESDVEEEQENEEENTKSIAPLKVDSTYHPGAPPQSKSCEQGKETTMKLNEPTPAASAVVEQQGNDKKKMPIASNAPKTATEKEKKSAQKKAVKQEREVNHSAGSGQGKQHQRRDDVESVAGMSSGNDTESRPKKQTPAQAMVEKISALLDSPGLSNRQRKQMIRQLEQAQATIQSQLLQNAAKATKAKVQAQAQQEKIANQKASNVSIATGNNGTLSKSGTGKESNGKSRQANIAASSTSDENVSGNGSGVSNSLMDQLRRGIRAEGLDLPPGITLTRLDAIQSEALRLKRESIRKISEPMKPVAPPLDPMPAMLAGSFGVGAGTSNPGMFVVNPMSPLSVPSVGQESVIMVNTGKLRGKDQQQSPLPEEGQNGASDRKKRNKRRNKNKNKDYEQADQLPSSIGASVATGTEAHTGSKLNDGSNIVTLRNPMFHSGSNGIGNGGMRPPGAAMVPDVQGARMTLGYDQPATIFKNNNGMFTIRNPALHHALSGGAPPEATGFRPFNAAYLVENGIMAPVHGAVPHPVGPVPNVTAAVPSGTSTIIPGSSGVPPYLQQYSSPALDESMGPRKCKSVIGSEMKNAQKQKQNSLQQGSSLSTATGRGWQHMNGTTGQDIFAPSSSSSGTIGSGRGESHYSSFNQYNLAGQDLLHSAPAGSGSPYGSGMLGSSGYYQGSGNSASVLSKGAAGVIGSERSHALSYLGGADASSSLATHCCDDEAPSAFFNGNSLGSLPTGSMCTRTRYDDLAFLQNLQPGQRLNSEVTIHSINESKIRRQQAQNFTHDIQITAIPAPSPPTSVGRGILGSQATPSSVSLQHMMHQQPQHLQQHRQQQLPLQDTQPHYSDLSPGSGSVCSGSGSGTRAGVALTDFMDSRVSGGSSSSASADLLASSMDAKSFLRDYQLGQLQQQMQDLQLQSQQQQLKGDFGDNFFATKQPIVSVGEHETNERDLESLERFNYYFHASSGNSNKSKMQMTREPAGGNNSTSGLVSSTVGTSNVVEEGNPGGVSIGGDELQRPQQPPIGTPSSKSIQQHRLQQNGTPISSAGSILYPATADSPASSVSVFDGISSSLSSQTHSFDDLYTGLLATASPPSSISGGIEGNIPLNIQQLQHQVSSETVPFSASGCVTSNELCEASHARNTTENIESATTISNMQ
uniref:Uncharacterized protein n=1 Tax=Anopheles christyi TaxID=43041 RepID=A0A182K0C5_9DIPT